MRTVNTNNNRGTVNNTTINNMNNNTSGVYTFENLKYNKAQGRLARVCLAQGPLVKVREANTR